MTATAIDPHATAKHTLTLLGSTYAALKLSAKKRGLEPNEIIVALIEDFVIEDSTIDAYAKKRIELSRRLVGSVVEAAKHICASGGFNDSITLDAITSCLADKAWAEDYRSYVEDDIYKHGNPLKGAINREFGYRVRAAIGGVVAKGGDDKALNVKVTGSIIQSYTPMKSFDPAAISDCCSSTFITQSGLH